MASSIKVTKTKSANESVELSFDEIKALKSLVQQKAILDACSLDYETESNLDKMNADINDNKERLRNIIFLCSLSLVASVLAFVSVFVSIVK